MSISLLHFPKGILRSISIDEICTYLSCSGSTAKRVKKEISSHFDLPNTRVSLYHFMVYFRLKKTDLEIINKSSNK